MTGQELSYDKHVCLEFGEYVSVEHTNKMADHIVGTICLRPTGNMQGRHWFINLVTGAHISRTRWTCLAREVIIEVGQLGQAQGMAETLTFTDRCANKIEDDLDDLRDYLDDGSYVAGEDSDSKSGEEDGVNDDEDHDDNDNDGDEGPDNDDVGPLVDDDSHSEDDSGHNGDHEDEDRDDDKQSHSSEPLLVMADIEDDATSQVSSQQSDDHDPHD